MINNRVVWFQDLSQKDTPLVGGKIANLAEMICNLKDTSIIVPLGFATTVKAYQDFLLSGNLKSRINKRMAELDIENIQQLKSIGKDIRQWIIAAEFPLALKEDITKAYQQLEQQYKNLSFAVRSSATAEDMPEASFAGQQETLLNVQGIESVLFAIKEVFASLYNDRAIAYRIHQGYSHEEVSICVGIQAMVRSDCGVSGVMFTLDTESGFDKVVLINASYGLGEMIVQGSVNPDEFYVYKPALAQNKPAIIRKNLGSKQVKMIYNKENDLELPARHSNSTEVTTNKTRTCIVPVSLAEQQQFCLTEKEIELLARQAVIIEEHYGQAMDIEWAKDGITQQIFILQARPETIKRKINPYSLERYELKTKGTVLVEGRSVGQRIGQGIARIIEHASEMERLNPGEILVTDMTDPDWEPVMKRSGGVVTNRGGRTCHAAIIARELGVPAVVGCGNATQKITDGEPITISCSEGDTGYVYRGLLQYDINRFELAPMPDLPFKIMMTVGNPERAFDFQRLPNAGVGLARLEFIINQSIGVHPRACIEWETLEKTMQSAVLERSAGYDSPIDFYINKLAEGVATLASAFWPKPVIVRLSDFKSNEYANLLGGNVFEPKEENPMLGWRGASRYVSHSFRSSFALECQGIRKVREQQGLTNVEIMVPFVRTPGEAKQVIELLAEQGLKRGELGLRLIMMCEIPANALMADEFLLYFDGFSIGSNDLTQLTLGLDRDSGLVAHHFDERDLSVQFLLQRAIAACKRLGKSISICGQGPSDHLDFAQWLIDQGIDSLSLNPDVVLSTWMALSKRGVRS